jgi:hypothetical protein
VVSMDACMRFSWKISVVLRFSYRQCIKWFNIRSILSIVVANIVIEEMSNVVLRKDC